MSPPLSSIPSAERLNTFCAGAILRAFRKQMEAGMHARASRINAVDLDELVLRWALSPAVDALAEHLEGRPRDMQATVDFVESITRGEISGAVDASASCIEQMREGDPTLFVVHEPRSSEDTGPNHLVAWTVMEAERAIQAAIRRHNLGPDYAWAHDRAKRLEDALRVGPIKDILSSPAGRRRPGRSAIRAAAKSRSAIYIKALAAFNSLTDIEDLRPEAIERLFSETLVAPLEDWRKFELATALAASESISQASGTPLRLRVSLVDEGPFAQTGSYAIHWQRSLPTRSYAALDESEQIAKDLAKSLGHDLARSRTDVSIVDAESGADMAHIECKWFGVPSSAAQAISDASLQLTRYARDSRPNSAAEARAFLKHCVVALATLGSFDEALDGFANAWMTDFDGIERGVLDAWAVSLVTSAQ
jgi:hypothetical protein